MRRFLLLCLLTIGVSTSPAAGQSPDVSLADVQQAYDTLSGLQANFTQIIGSTFANDSTRLDGSVLLSGNKYRVRTPNQTVVSNGTTTWIYTPADSQVVVNDADKEGTVTPETFLTASADRYEVTTSTSVTRLDAPHVKLTIASTDSSSRFTEAILWVRTRDRVVTRMKATDRNNSTIDLQLHDLVVDPKTLQAEAPFTFDPPDGVEVVDLRRSK